MNKKTNDLNHELSAEDKKNGMSLSFRVDFDTINEIDSIAMKNRISRSQATRALIKKGIKALQESYLSEILVSEMASLKRRVNRVNKANDFIIEVSYSQNIFILAVINALAKQYPDINQQVLLASASKETEDIFNSIGETIAKNRDRLSSLIEPGTEKQGNKDE